MSKDEHQPNQSPRDGTVIDIVEVAEDERDTSRHLVGNQLQPDRMEALVEQLRKALGSNRSLEPKTQGGPEAVLARLVQDARRRKRGPILLFSLFLAEFAALISLYLICALRGIRMSGIDVIVFVLLCVCLVLFCIVARVVFMPHKRRWNRLKAGEVVTKYDDIRLVGHLAEALTVRNQDVVTQAEIELTVLLPRMREADAALLNPDQRQCLYRSMMVRNIPSKSEFLIAALGVVERIGDTKALPEVMALASQEVGTERGRAVKSAAESCLQALRQTESEKEARRSLLRATSADSASGDELLRSAEHLNADNPDELLRAQSND